MARIDHDELFATAKEKFEEGQYKVAETLLHQVLAVNNRIPDLFYMLGTIYYDQGKFSKAIKAYQRALEIDPAHTDSSIGLSVIYNDLGRYEEGKEIFEKAQTNLHTVAPHSDPYIEEQFAKKHCELGELYFQYQRYNEAIDQFYKGFKLTVHKAEVMLKIVECLIKQGTVRKAIKELRNLVREYPNFTPARIKLGVLLYESKRVAEAVEQWESALARDGSNSEARRYLEMARYSESTLL